MTINDHSDLIYVTETLGITAGVKDERYLLRGGKSEWRLKNGRYPKRRYSQTKNATTIDIHGKRRARLDSERQHRQVVCIAQRNGLPEIPSILLDVRKEALAIPLHRVLRYPLVVVLELVGVVPNALVGELNDHTGVVFPVLRRARCRFVPSHRQWLLVRTKRVRFSSLLCMQYPLPTRFRSAVKRVAKTNGNTDAEQHNPSGSHEKHERKEGVSSFPYVYSYRAEWNSRMLCKNGGTDRCSAC